MVVRMSKTLTKLRNKSFLINVLFQDIVISFNIINSLINERPKILLSKDFRYLKFKIFANPGKNMPKMKVIIQNLDIWIAWNNTSQKFPRPVFLIKLF